MTPLRRIPLVLALAATWLAGTACGGPSTASTASAICQTGTPGGTLSPACDTHGPSKFLTGSGASSAQPFFVRAFFNYTKANPGVQVNYSPAGSSVGIANIQSRTVNFGDTEIPMPEPASGVGGAILQVPVDLGGVAISYNLPGLATPLRLDGPTLAGIFLGTITRWRAEAITTLNPGDSLPDLPIVAVHRSDKSGPAYDLEQYLTDTAGSAWTARTGTKASTQWPAAVASVGLGQQLNKGVADFIRQTRGAIGYVEYAYALQASPPFTNAALQNAAGAFVGPSVASITAAGANAANLSSKDYNIVDGPGAGTYPLANFNWSLLYQRQADTTTGVVLGKLWDWVTTTGQQPAASLGYAPLPANVVALAHQSLLSLQTASGQPLFG